MKSFLIALAFFAVPFFSFSQIGEVRLQAAGLTCSMCSNSIHKSLRSLSYVSDVKANLETSTFTVRFRDAAAVNFDELKKKVEDAGFSVTKMQVQLDLNGLQVANDTHTQIAGKQFHFVKVANQTLKGSQLVTLVDKGFLPAKQYKTYTAATQMECIKTGMMASCCKGTTGSRIYHITI